MTAKRVIWAVTAGLWMAAAAAGTAMGEEDTDKGPAYDTITEGVKKDVLRVSRFLQHSLFSCEGWTLDLLLDSYISPNLKRMSRPT